MADEKPKLYEGLFLLNQQAVAGDLSAAIQQVREILDRAEAEVLAISKWDDRRLAYPIDNQKRGLYILTYFSAPGESMAQLERDANLSDHILRFMVIRADHLTDEEMRSQDERQALADEAAMRREEAASQESGPADEGGEPVAAAESSSSAASEESE